MPSGGGADGRWLELRLEVGIDSDKTRLDRFLSTRIRRLSRARIQRIIAAGAVRREGRAMPLERCATRVRTGEVLILRRPAPSEPPVVLDYEVLHQDEDLLVVCKPAGLPVHPSARYHRNTLTALMRSRLGVDHPWVMAHRLDRETSGVLVFAKRGGASATMKTAFQRREVGKTYLALVHGSIDSYRRIDLPLGPAEGSRVRIKMGLRPPSRGGAEASTSVTPLAHGWFRQRPITLIRVQPHTGRQHQIRVHLDLIGHPVLGDKLYGLDEQHFIDITENGRPIAELDAMLGMQRHALHAHSLEVLHPGSGTPVCFMAPWPKDLARILSLPTVAAR